MACLEFLPQKKNAKMKSTYPNKNKQRQNDELKYPRNGIVATFMVKN